MSISATSGYTPLPVFKDMAAVLAARPAVAQMSSKAAVVASERGTEAAVSAAALASGNTGGSVDMYL